MRKSSLRSYIKVKTGLHTSNTFTKCSNEMTKIRNFIAFYWMPFTKMNVKERLKAKEKSTTKIKRPHNEIVIEEYYFTMILKIGKYCRGDIIWDIGEYYLRIN